MVVRADKLEIIEQPKIGIIRRAGANVGAGQCESAVFSALCTVRNIHAAGQLHILADIPRGIRLEYSGRVFDIVNGRKKNIEQRMQFDLKLPG